MSIGSKERHSEFNNPLLSSGGLTFSGNARPIPQVRIGIPEYTLVPGTKSWLAFKGHIAYGLFTDDGWQKTLWLQEVNIRNMCCIIPKIYM